ncbi:MAG: BamA/TamA family outer membrane protein [Bacteroidota bacterium]
MERRLLLFIAILSCFCCVLSAQPKSIIVDKITIKGNDKTRAPIILRELQFQKGDTIPFIQLEQILEESRQLVMNTGLFNKAHFSFLEWNGMSSKVHLLLEVVEAWYIFPVPIFELADRNFNVWWVEQNRSLDRINFGLEFTHLNITGRRDKLKLNAKYGYTRNYGFAYSLPYINKKQTLGLSIDVNFARNREVNYMTLDNKQAFFQNEETEAFLFKRFRSITGLFYRPGLRAQHEFYLSYRQNSISGEVAEQLNPDFFLGGKTLQRFFSFQYHYTYDMRDIRPYPMTGYYINFLLEKDGLGIFSDRDGLTLLGTYAKYHTLSSRWSMASEAQGKLSIIRSRQPYNDNRALGFSRYVMRGFEYYIVDGLDMGTIKSTLRYKLFERELNFGRVMPIKAFKAMPFKIFLTLNGDVGYVNGPYVREENFLNNKLLYSGGVGINFVLYYDKVIQINYSLNGLNEAGVFLHLNMNI